MSKSLGNTIEISASPEEIRAKLKPAFTDPARLRRSDPGNPEVCAIYTWYQKFLPEEADLTAAECRTRRARLRRLQEALAERRRRALRAAARAARALREPAGGLDEIVRPAASGRARCARETMARVHDAMGIG